MHYSSNGRRSVLPTQTRLHDTQQTFVNQLVGVLTLGIYTPMHIRVTCAQEGAGVSGSALHVPARAEERVVRATFSSAADLAVEHHRAVTVRFEE